MAPSCLPPKKFVRLHPVGKKLQLERVGLTTSSQVVVELINRRADCFAVSNFDYLHLRYEAAHEEVVVVVGEQGEALIGDRHRVTIGTRRGTIAAGK